MLYRDIYDRMKVDVPVGSVGKMKIDKFEVIHPDDWTAADEKRDDVVTPLQYWRMERDGRAPDPGWYTRLSDGGRTWMSDTTYERRDHSEAVFAMDDLKAERVIIDGLGLGMVLSAALSFDHVKHVDVIEKDERVIQLVGGHYLKDSRVRIHHADARTKVKLWGKDQRWDVGWTDIWPDFCADNLPEMKLFSDFYGSRCRWHGNWGEDIVKRSAWDNRHSEREYLKYLTEADKEKFEEEDYEEEDENYYDEEDDDE